jgi:hypothetical protein
MACGWSPRDDPQATSASATAKRDTGL